MNQANGLPAATAPETMSGRHERPLLHWCDGCGRDDALLFSHTRLDLNTGHVYIDEPTENFCPACVPVYRASNDAYIQLHQLITPLVQAWAAQAREQGVQDLEFIAGEVASLGIRLGIEGGKVTPPRN